MATTLTQLVRAAGIDPQQVSPAIQEAKATLAFALAKVKEVTALAVDAIDAIPEEQRAEMVQYLKGAQYAALAATVAMPTLVNRTANIVLVVPNLAIAINDAQRTVNEAVASLDGADKDTLKTQLKARVIDQAFGVVAALAPAAASLLRR